MWVYGLCFNCLNHHRYPETCGKTIEEIEEMFRKGGPYPWQTKKGHSKLDARIDEAREKRIMIKDIAGITTLDTGTVPKEKFSAPAATV
jgi:hypothetical protein